MAIDISGLPVPSEGLIDISGLPSPSEESDLSKSQASVPDVGAIHQERAQYEQQKAQRSPLQSAWETLKEEGGRLFESLGALPPIAAEETAIGQGISYLSRASGAAPVLAKGAEAAGAGVKAVTAPVKAAATATGKAITAPVRYARDVYKTSKLGTEADQSANALRMAAKDIQQGRMTELSDQIGPDAEHILDNLSKDISSKNVSVQEAEDLLSSLQGSKTNAEHAVTQLDQELQTKPQMSTEEFGKTLQDSAYNLYRQGVDTREEMAGFGKAIRQAGTGLKVDTTALDSKIGSMIKNTRNPGNISILNAVRSQLTSISRNKEVSKLNMESVDSLRKYLDKILATKRATLPTGQLADASEIRNEILQIRRGLMKQAGEANPAYKEALYNYAKYSRALDPFRGKGGLKGIQEMDQYSREYQMTQTQVVGKLLQGAAQGKETLGRLVQFNPEIRTAAKQFFSKELFGKGMPSEATYANFLKKNENALRQTGLYEDFKNMQSARKAARESLDVAEHQTKLAETQVKTERKGLSELETQKGKAEREVLKQESLKTKQAVMQKDLNYLESASPKESVTFSKGIIDDALKEGKISNQQHSDFVRQIKEIENKNLSAEEAKQKITSIVKKTLGYGVAGYIGEKAVSSTLSGY
jgi:hypothetical protein